MKFLRIIILLALVVSFIPLDAFCDDHQETTEHHHGIILCHASCHGAVLTSSAVINPCHKASYLLPSDGFIYEAPYLPTEVPPPQTNFS